MYKDVKKFRRKFGMLSQKVPGHVTTRKLVERYDFLKEELEEFLEGVNEQDLAKQADALVDLVYVALGTAASLGLPWKELWDDVHQCNMRKERGLTKRGHAVDCIKPEGWIPPSTTQILDKAGYDRQLFTQGGEVKEFLCADDPDRWKTDHVVTNEPVRPLLKPHYHPQYGFFSPNNIAGEKE
jgi:predicted HAD superfamily Cof-like phosphohydrolase